MIQIIMGVPQDQRLADLPADVRAILKTGRVIWHVGEWMPGASKVVAGYRIVHMITDYRASQINDFLQAHPELGWVVGYAAELFPDADGIVRVYVEPHQALIDYLDDIVTYDENGDPVSTERPTEYHPPHIWSIRGAVWELQT